MRLVGALLSLALCITAEAAAQPVERGAFVMVAVESLITDDSEDYTFTFQRVDLSASVFLEDVARVRFSGATLASSDEFRKPASMATPLRFAGVWLPAGDYALISRTHRRRGSRGASNEIESCFSYGAAIFAIREGVTNLITEDEFNTGPAQAALQQILPAHPETIQIAAPAEQLGHVSFATVRTEGQEGREYCRSDGTFSFRPPLIPTQPH